MRRPNDSALLSSTIARAGLVATGVMVAAPAMAHHPMGGVTPQTLTQGVLSGLGHPIIGLDHLAFLIVAALLAFTLTGLARWLVPAAFIGGTVAGTLIHVQAIDLPAAELLVAASALLGGALLMSVRRLNAGLMALLFVGAGIFHGYAYGESIIGAEQTVLTGYLAGFALIQYAVIAGLVVMLTQLHKVGRDTTVRVATRTGALGATAVGGLFLLAGLV